MYEITDAQISLFLQQYWLPFMRIGAMLMAMPVIGSRVIPARVRLVIASFLTLMVVPLMPTISVPASLSLGTFFLIARELLLGIAIGFSFQIVFQVFVLAGQFMAIKLGLGFASMNDPTNGVQTTVLSQFFLMLVTLTFLSMNGHLVLIELLIASFQTLPCDQFEFTQVDAMRVVNLGGWLFASSLLVALPVLTSLLVINIAFGVMSRAAPQLNIFSLGFPLTLICGMFLIWVGLSTFNQHFSSFSQQGFTFVQQLLRVK
jgi:flagellar biosynthesis protein FliR